MYLNWTEAFNLNYEEKTTFWYDFSIADTFGEKAIKDTFNRAFNEWKGDAIYLTELVIVTNIKCWHYYYKNNEKVSRLYSELYYKAHHYALNHLKGEDLEYYLRTTD